MIDPIRPLPLNDGEQVKLFLRQHWIRPVGLVVIFIFLTLLPFTLFILLASWFPDLVSQSSVKALTVLLGSTYLLTAVLLFFQTYLDYYLDTWIITNERIISFERTSLFKNTRSELRLYRLQDATAKTSGFLPTFFDYGDVHIQNAGETERFSLENVPHPKQVAALVIDLAEADYASHRGDESGVRTPPLAD